MVKKIIPLFLLLGAALVVSGCGIKFVPTEDKVKEELVGQTLWLNDEERPFDKGINLTKENLIHAEILDKQSDRNEGSIIAYLSVEMIEEKDYEENKQHGPNHIQHTFTGEAVIPYKLYEKEWRIEGLIVNKPFNHQEKEVEYLSVTIPSIVKKLIIK